MAPDDLSAPATCPFHEREDARKAVPAAKGGAWLGDAVQITNFDLARQLLRSSAVRQAGFKAELLERFTGRAHAPVLFQEGEAHQRQRSATARFFAPKVVTTRYRELMERLSDKLVVQLAAEGRAALDEMSLELAVAVAAEIVGLTDSPPPAMAARLNRFFAAPPAGQGRLSAALSFALGQYRMLMFYLGDVRPAIRARRRQRREDVISHLLDQGYSDREILTECLTYGAAGMATTREFIVMAAWHLLDREDLRARFLAADERGRITMLEEILRLEPVVGALYRRTERAVTLSAQDREDLNLPAGALVAIDVRAANTDPAAAGDCPFALAPDRTLAAPKLSTSLMSFGDGPHRCPGACVALQETAIFLDRLLRIPGVRLLGPPALRWNELISSYELRGAILATSR